MSSRSRSKDNIYLVEKIVGRRVKKGRTEYLVRWKGFPPEHDSWEPQHHLHEACNPLIEAFNVQRRALKLEGPEQHSSKSSVSSRISDPVFASPHNPSEDSNSTSSSDSPSGSRSGRHKRPLSTSQVTPRPLVEPAPTALNSSRLQESRPAPKHTLDRTTSGNGRSLHANGAAGPSKLPPPDTSSTVHSTPPLAPTPQRMIRVKSEDGGPGSNAPEGSHPSPAASSCSGDAPPQKRLKPADDDSEPKTSKRKSVTIMLKTLPTQEFHNTTSTHKVRSEALPPLAPKSQTSETKKTVSSRSSSSSYVGGGAQQTAAKSSKPVPPPNVNQKVLNVIDKLRENRRRPKEEVVQDVAKKMYDLSPEATRTALHALVQEGLLCTVNCSSGISYRYPVSTVARGDLPRHVNITNKIKARYAKQPSARSRSHVGSRKTPGGSSAGRSRDRTVSSSTPTGGATTSTTKVTPPPPRSSQDLAGESGNIDFATLKSLMGLVSSLSASKVSRSSTSAPGDPSGLVEKIKHLMPPNALEACETSRPGVSVYVLPPPAPINLEAVENSLKSLPHRRLGAYGSIAGSVNGDCSGEQTPPEKEVFTSAKPNSRPSSNLRSSVYRPDHDSSILIHRHPDKGFTELVLRSPGTPVQNSFTLKVLMELTKALHHATEDSVSLVLLCGLGHVFSSGIDLSALTLGSTPNTANGPSDPSAVPLTESSTADLLASQYADALRDFLMALSSFPKLLVAGVNGPALGLGVAMLPLFDLVYASDCATFHLPYAQLGQPVEGGASFTLPNLVGLPAANDLLLASRKLSAREAHQRGLVSDVLFPKNFRQELLLRCERLAFNSPVATETNKCLIRMQYRERVEFVIDTECRKLAEIWKTPNFRWNAANFLRHRMDDFV